MPMQGGAKELIDLGSRIKDIRERIGFSQERLGKAVGLSRSSIAQLEAGKRRLDTLMLRRMARSLGVSPLVLLGDQGKEDDISPDVCGDVMREVSDSSEEDRNQVGEFLEVLRHYARLRELQESEPAPLPPAGRPFTARTPKYLVSAEAIRVRQSYGLGDSPCANGLRRWIERLGIPVFKLPLEEDSISGLYANYPGIGPLLLVNGNQVRWRQTFTLAHEFGHVWLHRHHRAVASRIFGRAPETREMETQANSFAAEFLMPERAIRWVLSQSDSDEALSPASVVHLQRWFGVSYRAMLVRLKALRIISAATHQALGKESPVSWASQLGYRIDPSEVGQRRTIPLAERFPQEYVDLVLNAWKSESIGEARAAECLMTDLITFNEFVAKQARELAREQTEKIPPGVGG